ncbi:unnamed protein product [Linum trigynum]|uniref:Uncharacterized protein n=1 Tax=Linum trigynum TaxID=586398 RepID=A0AAV2DB74_9ROSI
MAGNSPVKQFREFFPSEIILVYLSGLALFGTLCSSISAFRSPIFLQQGFVVAMEIGVASVTGRNLPIPSSNSESRFSNSAAELTFPDRLSVVRIKDLEHRFLQPSAVHPNPSGLCSRPSTIIVVYPAGGTSHGESDAWLGFF